MCERNKAIKSIPGKLTTERLELVQLEEDWLNIKNVDIATLTKRLNCQPVTRKTRRLLKRTIEGYQRHKNISDTFNEQFVCIFLVVRNNDRKVVGSICVERLPNNSYGIYTEYMLIEQYRSLGYVSEAVSMIHHAILLESDITEIEISDSERIKEIFKKSYVRHRV